MSYGTQTGTALEDPGKFKGFWVEPLELNPNWGSLLNKAGGPLCPRETVSHNPTGVQL